MKNGREPSPSSFGMVDASNFDEDTRNYIEKNIDLGKESLWSIYTDFIRWLQPYVAETDNYEVRYTYIERPKCLERVDVLDKSGKIVDSFMDPDLFSVLRIWTSGHKKDFLNTSSMRSELEEFWRHFGYKNDKKMPSSSATFIVTKK